MAKWILTMANLKIKESGHLCVFEADDDHAVKEAYKIIKKVRVYLDKEGGKKLIAFDMECRPFRWHWLKYVYNFIRYCLYYKWKWALESKEQKEMG